MKVTKEILIEQNLHFLETNEKFVLFPYKKEMNFYRRMQFSKEAKWMRISHYIFGRTHDLFFFFRCIYSI